MKRLLLPLLAALALPTALLSIGIPAIGMDTNLSLNQLKHLERTY
ncbi:hypothetical protein [Prochlorococcus marinus]|nr:hypothetical protein [Prochlorococcus marinus]